MSSIVLPEKAYSPIIETDLGTTVLFEPMMSLFVPDSITALQLSLESYV